MTPQPSLSSADLGEFQARLEDIRRAIVAAIETGIKDVEAANQSGSTRNSGTIAAPEPTLAPTTEAIMKLAVEHLQNPDLWFNSPNPRFNGRKPAELLGTKDEIRVYWALSAFDAGLF